MNLILGTGPLAKSIMSELMKRGEPVRMVSLSGKAQVPQGVEVTGANLMDPVQASDVMKGAKVVFHCAAPPYHQWKEQFPALQQHIVTGAIRAEAKLVVAENVYMYGPVQGELHEGLPNAATTKKGKVRAELSQHIQELHKDGILQVVIGRGADVYGPGVRNSAVGASLFKTIIRGKPCTVVGDPDKKHSYTYIHDFGRALVLLSGAEDSFGEVWHVPNAPAVTTRDFIETAYRIAGFPGHSSLIRRMGIGMLKFGGIFMPVARESIEMLYQFEEDFVVASRKFTARFGMEATPIEQGLKATMDALIVSASR